MREVDKAWLAGIIDGEGCIGIYKRKPKRGKIQYILQIVVAMTHKITIEKIVELSGVGNTNKKPQYHNERSRDQWEWCIAARNAKYVLELIRPYSVTKKQNIELGLEFQNRISNFQAFSGQPIPQKELDKRENMKLEMNKLNKRGVL